jgi:hypothetical protein
MKIKNSKLKITLALLLMSGLAFAIDGDFNADDQVDMADWAVVASAYDPNDANTVADAAEVWSNWLAGMYAAPTVRAVSARVLAGEEVQISLLGTQGTEAIVSYDVNTPSLGTLEHLSGADYLYTAGVTEGNDIFAYRAFDGTGYSDYNSVTITVTANTPPVLAGVSKTCWAGETVDFTLSATDVDPNQTITYQFTSQPQHGSIYGSGTQWTYLADPDANGIDNFDCRAYDGIEYSTPMTFAVTNSIRPLDCVNINARAAVVIPDGNTVIMDNSWMIAFWVKTKWPFGSIFSKRDPGGAGVEITVENNVAVARLYDANGTCYELIGDSAISTGEWVYLSLTYESTGNYAMNLDPNYTADFWYQSNTEYQSDANSVGYTVASDILSRIPSDANFNNTADMVFGGTEAMPFYGAFSSFSYYATAPDSLGYYFVNLEGRGMHTVTGWSPTFTYRFPVNEGTGTAVKDTTAAITGAIADPNKIEWASEVVPVDDTQSSRKRLRTKGDLEYLINSRKKR